MLGVLSNESSLLKSEISLPGVFSSSLEGDRTADDVDWSDEGLLSVLWRRQEPALIGVQVDSRRERSRQRIKVLGLHDWKTKLKRLPHITREITHTYTES